jgi:hypothetical protein
VTFRQETQTPLDEQGPDARAIFAQLGLLKLRSDSSQEEVETQELTLDRHLVTQLKELDRLVGCSGVPFPGPRPRSVPYTRLSWFERDAGRRGSERPPGKIMGPGGFCQRPLFYCCWHFWR